jgi:hypothetical protein
MNSAKTIPTRASVEDFLKDIEPAQRRLDGFELLEIMKEITKEKPVMWGSSIVGFGSVHYKYKSGREGEWFKVGFSPRKKSLSVYIMSGFDPLKDLLEKLGKHKLGKGCLYINKLDDIDMDVLRDLIKKSLAELKNIKVYF